MVGLELQDEPRAVDRWWLGSLSWVAAAWVIGSLIGRQVGGTWAWFATAAGFLVLAVVLIRRGRSIAAVCVVLASIAVSAAGWWGLRATTWGLDATPISRLARIEGLVEGPIYIRSKAPGLMGRFDYRPPATLFYVDVERGELSDGPKPVRGRVLVNLPGEGAELSPGDRVRCTGWLSFPTAPANPGERDRRIEARDRGVLGHLALEARGNCERLDAGADGASASGVREALTERAKWALSYGIADPNDPSRQRTVELLEVLLLGDWRGDLDEVRGTVRRAGLMHVLAISGLQLGILAVGTWAVLLPLLGRPRAAACGSLAAVGLLMLVVPPGVAVLRAGLMSAVTLAALTLGRRVSPISTLCGAAIVLLAWRPWDLFGAGFQLTFLIVMGLIAFTPRVTDALAPPPLVDTGFSLWVWARRKAAAWVAVSLIAWCISTPLVAYHFGAIVPAGLFTALPALPLVVLLMWLGYAKILVTPVFPALGEALGKPLVPLAEALAGLASWSADWPAAMIGVARPSALWTLAALGVVGLIFTGRFARRRLLAAACIVLLWAWLFAPTLAAYIDEATGPAALRVHMFAVGHGSCYLLRSRGETLVYDCGSSNHPDITTSTIGPALLALGVHRVDTLIISHPDADHYSGALELVDGFGVERVLMPRGFSDEAERTPEGAVAFLIEGLRERRVPIETIATGWEEKLGEAELRALWPPPGERFARQNDGSIVLKVHAAGRSVLLTGDIQQRGMERLLADPSLAPLLPSDVLELPHHGAMVDGGPAFVRAVAPSIVLQSTDFARVRRDAWAEHLAGFTRHVSTLHGAAEVALHRDGTIHHHRFSRGLRDSGRDGPYHLSSPNVEIDR